MYKCNLRLSCFIYLTSEPCCVYRAVSCFVINIKYNFSSPSNIIYENQRLHLAHSQLIFHKKVLYPSFLGTAKLSLCLRIHYSAFLLINTQRNRPLLTLQSIPSMPKVYLVLCSVYVIGPRKTEACLLLSTHF